MKKGLIVCFIALLGTLGSVFALESDTNITVMEGLRQDSNFSELVKLIDDNGLADTLNGAGPFTLLAPSNEAITAFSNESANAGADMAAVLKRHVLDGKYSLRQLKDLKGNTVATAGGDTLKVEDTAEGLEVDGVRFDSEGVDNEYSNGYIHVVNKVIVPGAMNTGANDAATTTAAAAATTAAAMSNMTMAPASTSPATVNENDAMVRFVHLSPNAPAVSVSLTAKDNSVMTPDALKSLSYTKATNYMAVPAGEYTVDLSVGEGSGVAVAETPLNNDLAQATVTNFNLSGTVLSEPLTFEKGKHYTVALTGFALPSENVDVKSTQAGFFGWLGGVFERGTNRNDVSLRLNMYEDDLGQVAATQERVRVVNAVPGGANDLDVVGLRADASTDDVSRDLGFTKASDFKTLNNDVTQLELRQSGSDTNLIDLSNILEMGKARTIFITGTEYEGTPLHAVILTDVQK